MSYNLLVPIHIVTDGDMSGDIASSAIETKLQDNLGIQLTWTGAPVGTFSVQVSIDYSKDINGNVVNTGHWTSLPLNPAIAASGAGDTAYIDVNQLTAPYLRVLYTKTSGSGVLNAIVAGRAI